MHNCLLQLKVFYGPIADQTHIKFIKNINLPFAPTLIVAYCVVSSTTYKYIYSSSGWNFYDSFTVNGTSFTLKLINYNNTTVYWRAYE